MIDCFSISLSRESSEDKTTNQMSLFSFIETMSVDELGMGVAFHVIAHWFNSGEPTKAKIKFRFKSLDRSSDEYDSPEYDWEVPSNISRVRLIGFNTPSSAGIYRISTLLQAAGSETWQESSGSWVFQLEQIRPS